jgi:hypothetical protein
MMAYIAGGAPVRSGIMGRKMLIATAIVVAVGISVLILYFYLSFASILHGNSHVSVKLPVPSIGASIASQDVLSHNSLREIVPYVLLDYASSNVTRISANATLFKYPPPRRAFVLNISNECYDCGDTAAIESAISFGLERYGLILGPGNLSSISPSDVAALPPNSILIILNGLLPSSLLQANGSSISGLTYLLNEHTSIIYVGQDFSRMLLPDSIVTPTPASLRPYYLDTIPHASPASPSGGFYFDSGAFLFAGGTNYSTASYINVYNGSIFMFPNTPNSWPANQSGADIAKAVRGLFWLPKYAYGTSTITLPTAANSQSQLGVVLDSAQAQPGNTFVAAASLSGSIRVSITANATYPAGTSNSTYKYVFAKPVLYQNGTITVQGITIANQSIPVNFTVYTKSSTPINITPSLTIYTTNMSVVQALPLPFIHNVPDNFTFIRSERLPLPPGRQYIMELRNFVGVEYAAALFNVSPITINVTSENLTNDSFMFSALSQKIPITGLNYSISLNNLYPANGTIRNGLIFYYLPKGTPAVHGVLNFTLNVMGSKSYFEEQYYPAPFGINQQYIEISVVAAVMLLMIVLVKAPNRDEFYIDVPNLPEATKIPLTLKPADVVGVFDKLNMQYHWKYMPLTKAEIRSAISTYIKVNNISVALTYDNVDRMVDMLAVNKYLTAADELFAPPQWVDQSKHDIEYLAVFKKLRIYLVTHAYTFTDLDVSQSADVVATLRSEKKYLVIYSKTSNFQKVPIYTGSRTYLVFLNSYRLEEFKDKIYNSTTMEAEELKMYVSAGYLKLVDADDPEETLN